MITKIRRYPSQKIEATMPLIEPASGSRQNITDGYHPFFIVILILCFHIICFYNNYEAILNQITTRDFDGYWHLLRVENLYNSGNIYQSTVSRSNAPYGESIHWTSAFDLILYAGAYLGSLFVEFKDALFWWSIFVNPVLHILSFLVLFWALRDLIGRTRASLFGIILLFQVYFTAIFNMGVPDHHGVLIFIFCAFIALIIRSMLNGNRNTISICGIIGGLAIWFGIESIAVVLIAFFVFGLAWMLEGKKHQNKNLLFSFFLLSTTLLTMFIDTRPDEMLNVVYDRRSIIHVFLWLITTGFWALINLLGQYTQILEKQMGRIIAATIGAAVCLLLMHELFPLFYKNPLSEVDPAIKLIYLNQTTEFTGLFSDGNDLPKQIIAHWAMLLPGVPISMFLAWRSLAEERLAWIFIMLINTAYIILSILTLRMITYAELCALIPMSYAIYLPFKLISLQLGRPYNMIARSVYILTCCFCISYLPIVVFGSSINSSLIHDRKFLSQICQYLNEDPYFNQEQRRILTSIYLGPLLLYKTPHEVVGTPSHRNVSGILDTYSVMNAQREEDAYMAIRRRGIQAILIGRPEHGIGDFFYHNINNTRDSDEIFHHHLWEGKFPAWLQPYEIPKALEGNVKVFKVINPGATNALKR